MIIREYYYDIFSLCLAMLKGNRQAAEDCTQETFLVFFSKHEKLYISDSIGLWLCRTAERVVKAYIRKNPGKAVSIDVFVPNQVSDPSSFEISPSNSVFDSLDQEEMKLLEMYYDCSNSKEREELAEKYGITMSALYSRIHKIRNKLRGEMHK